MKLNIDHKIQIQWEIKHSSWLIDNHPWDIIRDFILKNKKIKYNPVLHQLVIL